MSESAVKLLRKRVDADLIPVGEGPLSIAEVLACGLCVAGGRNIMQNRDIQEGAYLFADLSALGWRVKAGTNDQSRGAKLAVMAKALAGLRRRDKPEPRDDAAAEHVVAEVRALGHDLWAEVQK